MSETLLYVGSYTSASSVGIRVYDASDPDGGLVERSQVEGVEHPSFLAAHPNGRVLYAVSETTSFDGRDGGGLLAYRIDPADGSLTPLDRASSHGSAPCHLSLDGDGRHLYVANYLSGTIAAYALSPEGRFRHLVASEQHHGSGPTARQKGPHAHCVVPGPLEGTVYAADLGTDRVIRYGHHPDGGDGFDVQEQLSLAAGAGPRHLRFHPNQPVALLVCELSSTLAVLSVDPATGRLRELGSHSTLPEDFVGESTAAEVCVDRRGHRIYVSNRGHDSIAVFGFTDPENPLEVLGHVPSGGRTPRNFALHPSGRSLLVANQDSHTIVPFAIDQPSGMPEQLDVAHRVSEPACLTFVEVGQ